jgi:dihydrofolate reductase
MKNISIIVAIADDFAIGLNNDLLCHLSGDLKRFKTITTGHQIIMGKRTYESLPKRPLPNRTNVVISDDKNDQFEGCVMVYSIDEALENCGQDESFIIGGGSIYRQFLPYANKLYLTVIHHKFVADTYFPVVNYEEWNTIHSEEYPRGDENPYDYTFMILERKSK